MLHAEVSGKPKLKEIPGLGDARSTSEGDFLTSSFTKLLMWSNHLTHQVSDTSSMHGHNSVCDPEMVE